LLRSTDRFVYIIFVSRHQTMIQSLQGWTCWGMRQVAHRSRAVGHRGHGIRNSDSNLFRTKSDLAFTDLALLLRASNAAPEGF